ncbi:MAG: hemerythrin domain-containing protein [Deltaproteobacteria bacterium]|nr:MAG: hemerythrin domain-containing protein [Deltaproteobacteria bacterium]
MTDPSETLAALRWWQEHSALDGMVETLVEAIEGRDSDAARAAAEDLFGAMDAHAREEEAVYFPLIERYGPDQADAIRRARAAHVELREDLDAVRSALGGGDLPAARGALEQLLERFRLHEEAEARLLDQLRAGSAAERSG